MSETRPWTFENLLVMFVTFFGCLLVGGAVQQAFIPAELAETADGRFMSLVIQSVSFHVGGFFCIGLLLTLDRRTWHESFGLKNRPLQAIGLGLGGALVATPVVMYLQLGIARLIAQTGAQPNTQQIVRTIQESTGGDQLFVYGLVTVLLAPVFEELLFRGILYRSIKLAGHPRIALWGTSILFGLIHVNTLAIIPLTLLALLLAHLYDRTNNILAPILAHATFNSVNFALVNAQSLQNLAQ